MEMDNSMEALSCLSSESARTTAKENTFFEEANAINISARFQFCPPYGFWEDDFFKYFISILGFRLPWQPIKLKLLDTNDMFRRGLLKEHLCKTFVKISALK